MTRIHILLIFMMVSAGSVAQPSKTVDSKITNVTVFLNRAQVTRMVKTKLEPGKTTVVFPALAAQLDQRSIQVRGSGKFTILGIAHQLNYGKEFSSPRTKVLTDSIEWLQQQIAIEQSQKEVLAKEEQMLLSNQKIGGTNQNLTAAELKAMADFFRGRLNDIISQRSKIDNTIRKMSEQLRKVQLQLKEINDVHSKHTSEIHVNISADVETAAEFEVTYAVSNAGWTPVYDLRAIDTKNPVQLNYKANVFQSTGEEWKNVKLTLSTANPSLGGVKPELSTLFVDILNPVVRTVRYAEKKRAVAAAPASVSMDVEAGEVLEEAETSAEYTTTVQTSLSTEFQISLPYTVASASKPTLVDIGSHSLKADYLYSVVPKLDKDAFLMARVTGWEEYNLLPGEANVFFEGTFVAKTFIDPENIQDTLAVSLGRDRRVVVQREKIKDYSSRKTIGSNQRDSYGYTISVRNAKSEDIKVVIEDQIPVSKNSQVEVTLLDQGGATYQKEYGKLRWEISMKPQESKKMEYKFEVKYPKDKRITQIF